MNKYTFEYWFLDRDEISDYGLVDVKAVCRIGMLILRIIQKNSRDIN